jgi:hypothetical protein
MVDIKVYGWYQFVQSLIRGPVPSEIVRACVQQLTTAELLRISINMQKRKKEML